MSDVSPEVPQEPSVALDLADLVKRLEALERMGLTPRLPGEIVAWTGLLASLSGEQEVKPGWLLCNGTAVSRAKWQELFDEYTAAGLSRYGVGDGSTTFTLPQLVGKGPMGKSSSGTLSTAGATGGSETVTLTSTEMPSHGHSLTGAPSHGLSASNASTGITVNASSASHPQAGAGSNSTNTSGGSLASATHGHTINDPQHTHGITGSITIGSLAVSNSGSGGAHVNLQPYQVVEGWLVYAGRKAA